MTAVGDTGEFVAVWRPTGVTVESAPWRTTVTDTALDELDPDANGIVELPGGVRYFIGHPHPCRPGLTYLHRLT